MPNDRPIFPFQHYFNTGAFYAPPDDAKGNAGLGIIRAPGVNNWGLTLGKTFRVTEKVRTEFRCDMLNAFNHTQWSSVDSYFNDAQGSTSGWITGARDPRFVQFLLRVPF